MFKHWIFTSWSQIRSVESQFGQPETQRNGERGWFSMLPRTTPIKCGMLLHPRLSNSLNKPPVHLFGIYLVRSAPDSPMITQEATSRSSYGNPKWDWSWFVRSAPVESFTIPLFTRSSVASCTLAGIAEAMNQHPSQARCQAAHVVHDHINDDLAAPGIETTMTSGNFT